MSGGTFTIPNSIFLISQSSSNLFRLDTSRSTLSGLDVLMIGVFFIDFVKFWPDLVRSPRDNFDSRPIPESWLELELFLEDSSLFVFVTSLSRLSLLDLTLLVPGLRPLPPLSVLLTFLGDPLGEFFSACVRDSSRLLVCGVLPAPLEGTEPVLVVEAGECEEPPGPPLTFTDRLELLVLFRRLLEDLPCEDVLTGENSVFPPRRPSPTSGSVECSLDFMVRLTGPLSWPPSGHISTRWLTGGRGAGVEIKTHPGPGTALQNLAGRAGEGGGGTAFNSVTRLHLWPEWAGTVQILRSFPFILSQSVRQLQSGSDSVGTSLTTIFSRLRTDWAAVSSEQRGTVGGRAVGPYWVVLVRR